MTQVRCTCMFARCSLDSFWIIITAHACSGMHLQSNMRLNGFPKFCTGTAWAICNCISNVFGPTYFSVKGQLMNRTFIFCLVDCFQNLNDSYIWEYLKSEIVAIIMIIIVIDVFCHLVSYHSSAYCHKYYHCDHSSSPPSYHKYNYFYNYHHQYYWHNLQHYCIIIVIIILIIIIVIFIIPIIFF